MFKKGSAPTETSTTFSTLDKVSNLNYTNTDTGITITWKGIATPKALDAEFLKEKFANNVYKYWGDKYLNYTISRNNEILGNVGYAIYLNGTYLTTTTDTKYTYNGIILDKAEITVKTTYTNYNGCDSEGVSIEVKPSNNIPETTTKPITPSENNDFEIRINGSNSMTESDYRTLKNSGTLITVVDKDGKTVPNDNVAIEYIEDSKQIIINVKYQGKTKSKSINIVND